MFRFHFALLCCLVATSAQAGIEEFEAWNGTFERESASGALSRERWWSEGNLMRGESSRLGPDGRWVVGERMLLVEIGAAIYYVALPNQNRYPTAFELIAQEDGEAIFENSEHDFPQRIAYRADETGLRAWIAGADGEKHFFEYRRIE